MIDTYGRVATDLRVSLTDRCNLRCTYCMPAQGLDWLPGEQLLSTEELTRLLGIAVTRLGVTHVRFTGGEPLMARHLEASVRAVAAMRPRPDIARPRTPLVWQNALLVWRCGQSQPGTASTSPGSYSLRGP